MNRSECRSETQLSRASAWVKFPNALGMGPSGRDQSGSKDKLLRARPGAEISGIIYHPHFVIFPSRRSISFLLEIGRYMLHPVERNPECISRNESSHVCKTLSLSAKWAIEIDSGAKIRGAFPLQTLSWKKEGWLGGSGSGG